MSVFYRNNFRIFNLARLKFVTKTNYKLTRDIHILHSNQTLQYRESFRYLATAAQNVKPLSETDKVFSKSSSLSETAKFDEVFTEMNYVAKRTGRVVLDKLTNLIGMIENAGVASSTQGLYLIRSCGLLRLENPTKRVELMHKVWNKLESLGISFDVKHYNALLKIYLENNHKFTPSDILISMEQNGVTPNQTTYRYLNEKYCEDGDLNGANEILECIKEKGIAVNEDIFNSLIKGHMKVNDEDGARQIMEVMRNSNVIPSDKTYTILACCYAEKGNISKIEEILSEAEQNGILLNNEDYLKILLSLNCNEHSEYAEKILAKMDNHIKWRNDYLNTTADLIHKNMDEFAYKLISLIVSSENYSATNLFVRQLIKANRPVEQVIKYCQKIQDTGLNGFIFVNAARASVEFRQFDNAMDLFLEMHKRGIPVRNHDFRSFFDSKQSPESVYKYLRCMSQLGMPVDFYTYKECILPCISTTDPEATISKIKECGQTELSVVDALFQLYCEKGEIENANFMIQKFVVCPNPQLDLAKILSFYGEYKKNPSEYFQVLKFILENMGSFGQKQDVVQGKKLAFFLSTSPKIFDEFHKFAIGQNCNYSPQCLDVCRTIIRRKNPSLMSHLKIFGVPKENEKQLKEISVEVEESILNSDMNGNQAKKGQLLELAHMHLKNKDAERLNRVIAELDNLGFLFSASLLSQLFFFHIEMNNVDKAKEVLMRQEQLYPNYKIDTAKMFEYARLLLKFSKTKEAIDVIKNYCQEINNFTGEEMLVRNIRRFLNNVVQTGDVDLACKMPDLLKVHCGHPLLKEAILEPPIKVHVYRGDLQSCLKECGKCADNFRCIPCFNLVLKKIIIANNQSDLQVLLDIASNCEGTNKVLHKLTVAFVDLGKLQQAKKIIQKLNRDIDFMYFAEVGMEYYHQNRIVDLENLLYVTSGLVDDSRKILYHHLIKMLEKKNDWKKVAQVLDDLRNESFELSDDSKTLVNNLFAKNSQPIPFENHSPKSEDPSTANILMNDEALEIIDFLNQGDVDKCLQGLEKMKKGQVRMLRYADLTSLIQLLVEKNRLQDIHSNVNLMSYIIENPVQVFKTLVEKYSDDGDVEALQSLASVFPDFALRKINFNNYIAKAYASSNRLEELLMELEKRCQMKNRMFSVRSFEELIKVPEYEDRLLKLSKTYLESGFELPMATLWAYYFISERFDKAEEISKIHPIAIERIDSIILREMYQKGSVDVGLKYAEEVSQMNVKDRTKERAYGAVIDLLVLRGRLGEAVNLVMEAKSKNLSLEKHYRSTLVTLKTHLESRNEPVPFKISAELDYGS